MSVQKCIQLWKQTAPRAAAGLQHHCRHRDAERWGARPECSDGSSLGKSSTSNCHLRKRAAEIKDAFLWTGQQSGGLTGHDQRGASKDGIMVELVIDHHNKVSSVQSSSSNLRKFPEKTYQRLSP